MKRALMTILAADLVLCAWYYLGRPGGRCHACRARLGLAPHQCTWAAAGADNGQG